jgi:hypothetical protein
MSCFQQRLATFSPKHEAPPEGTPALPLPGFLTSFLVKAIDVEGAIDQKPPMSNSATRVIWEIGKHPRIPRAMMLIGRSGRRCK